MKTTGFVIVSLFSLNLLAAPLPNKTQFDLHDGKVSFLSIGRPAAIKIRGVGEKLKGQLTVQNDLASGDLIFNLDSLDTGIEMRNKHMKEKYLETGKYNEAKLTINKLKIPEALLTSDSKAPVSFEGILSLHGVEHPVHGESTLERKNNKLTGEANFDINLTDYKIEIPTYLGVTVADTVKLSVNFNADSKEIK